MTLSAQRVLHTLRQQIKSVRLLIVLSILAIVAAQLIFIQPAKAVPPVPWTLVWSDEFNTDGFIDPANWNFEYGGDWGQHELQYYTPAGQNASVSAGSLTITALNNGMGYTCWYGPCKYTSARMSSQGLQAFAYGRIEARMKLPVTKGSWPAFWLLGANIDTVGWPKSGEIDVMEHTNNINFVNGHIHWYDNNQHMEYGCGSDQQSITLDVRQWHTYMVEWQPNAITWFVDNKPYCQAVQTIQKYNHYNQAFTKPMYILLNIAIGGPSPGSPDSTSRFPMNMVVDYVRVYQNGTGSVVPLYPDRDENPKVPLCADDAGTAYEEIRADVPKDIGNMENEKVSVFCRLLTEASKQGVSYDQPVTRAVEVFAFRSGGYSAIALNNKVQVCLKGSGKLMFRDATNAPRHMEEIPSFMVGDYTCGMIHHMGTLLLVPGTPRLTVSGPQNGGDDDEDEVAQVDVPLSSCRITTRNIMNLRSEPRKKGSVIALVPTDTNLQATARAGKWIKVIYQNTQGYLAASLVNTDGDCGS